MIDLMNAIHTQNASYHLITEFYNALGKGVNKKALKDWIIASSPLVWSEKEVCFKRTKKLAWDGNKLEAADSIPYFEFAKITKTPAKPTFDLDKRVATINKAIAKLQAELKVAGSSVVLELLVK
jgi:hypothetical protein